MAPTKKEARKITSVIMRILGGEKRVEDKKIILKIMDNLKKRGSEAVIIGCTDVSLLFGNEEENQKAGVIDALDAVTESAVKKALMP